MDIVAPGLLSKREMQIISVIIRESWGWDKGQSNWTKKPLSNDYFAGKTGLAKETISRELKRMILEEKILVQDKNFYSFNEHPERWKKLIKHQLSPTEKVDKTSTESGQNINWKVINYQLLSDKTSTFSGFSIDITTISIKDLRERLKLPKEIFKEIFKEIKECLILFYQEKISKDGLRTFDETREKMLKNRLEYFSLTELKKVIENISNDDWYMGRDPKTNGKKYNSFELLFRNNRQVEKYLNLGTGKKTDYPGIRQALEEFERETSGQTN